jgi:hypothetical protein
MREILPDQLWLGNAGDCRDPERILQSGIAAVVNLAAEEPSSNLPRSVIYCRFPIMDGAQDTPGVLDTAMQTLVLLLQHRIPTLVYCSAGMSRSPAVVAAALSITFGGSPEERLRQVVSGQPHDVSPRLWESVCRACADAETISLSTNPDFIAIVERSRQRLAAEGSISSDEMRKRSDLMSMAGITLQVDENVARAFATATSEEQRKIQLLLSLRLQDLLSSRERPLEALMDEIGAEAEARGMTPEVLESLLDDNRQP